MRFEACLPNSWWEFCVEHALYLYNRTPIKRLKWITPFEIIKGEKPDLSNLKIFGCAAYVFLPPEVRKNKLSPKSELMIFLGFKPGMKGYRFMHLPNNVIFMGATALFDEKLFSKCDKPSIPGLSDFPDILPDESLNDHVSDDSSDSNSNHSEEDDDDSQLPVERSRSSKGINHPKPPIN